ncbi:MAG TPA: oligosaccharide flippase family protein, partial [Solirubrobacteraceae bacterium]|nr:oligosaccharide flippase family protein [Solirubrobacteraceae bacterium]
ASLLIARGTLILALGLGANIALARLLEPRDFGLVALGTVLLAFGTLLSDAGLGAGLIRRPEPPSRTELRAIAAVQLGLTLAVVAAATLVALPIGRDGLVVAVMAASLPIAMLKVPGTILLERDLRYRVVATVDVVEAVAFYGWALVAVALGAGIWGFATAAPVRAVAGAVTMMRLGPVGPLRPRWSWPSVRPLLGFGARYQGAVVVGIVRDQSLNVGIALIAGIAALGVWNLAWRVLQIPLMVFGALGRIGFPAMARLLEAGHDPRPVIERGAAALAVLSGAMMVAFVAFAPALPVVLGPDWHDVPAVLLWSGLAVMAILPVALGSSPYLFASGSAGTVVLAASLGAVVWLAVALPLVPSLGAPAAAIGWCAGAIVQLAVLATRTIARTGAALGTSVGVPLATGIAAVAAAWLVTDAAGRTVGGGALGLLAGEALLFGTLLALRLPAMRDTRGLVVQAIGSLSGTSAAPASRVGVPG